jgi:hypothetical protein
VSNAVAQDSRLTFEARGVMLYLLSKPNNWHIQKEDLMREGYAGKDRILRILDELEQHRYINWSGDRRRLQLPSGKFLWLAPGLYEARNAPCSEKPPMAKPRAEKPESGNPEDGKPESGKPDTYKERVQSTEGTNENLVDSENGSKEEQKNETHTLCVPPQIEFSDQEDESNPWDDDPHSYETVEKYVNYCLHYLGHDIRNPPGLVKTILKERNPRDYYAIETRLADREMELQAEQERREQQEADRLQRAREEEELQQREEAQRNENERLRAEENERRRLREITEAPAREAQRLNQEKRDRQERIEECETAIKTWSSQTAIETFINAKLSPGEKADLQNRLTSRAASGR